MIKRLGTIYLILTLIVFIFSIVFFCYSDFKVSQQENNQSIIENNKSISQKINWEFTDDGLVLKSIDISDWQIYRNEDYGFEFKYPNGWVISEEKSVYGDFSFIVTAHNSYYDFSVAINSPSANGKRIIKKENSASLNKVGNGLLRPVNFITEFNSGYYINLLFPDDGRVFNFNQDHIISKNSFNANSLDYSIYYGFSGESIEFLDKDSLLLMDKMAESVVFIDTNLNLYEENSEIDTSSWIDYRNSLYGFKFKYPVGFNFVEKRPNDEWFGRSFIARFTASNNELLFTGEGYSTYPDIVITIFPIEDYFFEDKPGGGSYGYDAKEKSCLSNGIEDDKQKEIYNNWFGCSFGTGDAGYGFYGYVIPNESKDIMIEFALSIEPGKSRHFNIKDLLRTFFLEK